LDQSRILPSNHIRPSTCSEYQRNPKLLNDAGCYPHAFSPRTAANREIICAIAASGRTVVTLPETIEILKNYDIPAARGGLARNPEQARALASEIGFPVALKIVSPDIIYETDVGGIVSGVRTKDTPLIDAALNRSPGCQIFGVYVEQMIEKRHELLIGSKKDPIFGPVIVFGMGGVAVDIFKDATIDIPPLNMSLAQKLIDRTKISALLKGHRDTPAVDVDAIQFLLYKFAYLIMDFPEIKEMDINPFVVDEHGGFVLDAKIILDEATVGKPVKPYSHLVICPYPKEYETAGKLKNGETELLVPSDRRTSRCRQRCLKHFPLKPSASDFLARSRKPLMKCWSDIPRSITTGKSPSSPC
jgi:acetyltransferase